MDEQSCVDREAGLERGLSKAQIMALVAGDS